MHARRDQPDSSHSTWMPKTVLLCGAGGFIGRHVRQALLSEGHRVISGVSTARPVHAVDAMPMDFSRDTEIAHWLPRLLGVDAVVNTVGVLRDSRSRPMARVHQTTPIALFEACAQAGVRRIIHVSALGIEGNPTRYAQTKLAADERLLALNRAGRLDGVVLRPSIVFGPEGDSARLFMALARSPALLLPGAVLRAKVQPLAVGDLAAAVPRLLREADNLHGMVPCVGPMPLSLAAFIASLRDQLGKPPAWVGALPEVWSRLSARIGDHIPAIPWCSETLALLAQDNVAQGDLFGAVLGRAPLAPTALLKESWA
jgi:uncharacterized protein YbjT (DUF2867 family)